MADFSLTSHAFQNGSEIPRKYGYKNGNVSPPLTIQDVPNGTESLVLIMDDPDAMGAVGKIWAHWLLWNIASNIDEISENSIPSNSVEGKTDFGEIGYGGPAPPDKRHTYIFKLYAISKKLDLPKETTKTELETSIKNSIIAETKLTGTYAP